MESPPLRGKRVHPSRSFSSVVTGSNYKERGPRPDLGLKI